MGNIAEIIKNRRTISPLYFNDKKISENDINDLLEAANRAPTHGHTEPWRFIVFEGEQTKKFGINHADMYKKTEKSENFLQKRYDKLKKMGEKSSHIIVVYNKPGNNPKIHEREEICASACATQNMLLLAEEKGIKSFWSTGGMFTFNCMKEYLKLEENEKLIGVIFLGYSDEKKEGNRKTTATEKTKRIK